MSEPVGRREALRLSALAATCGVIPVGLVAGQPSKPRELAPVSSPPFLTLAKDFQDVSRGDPVPWPRPASPPKPGAWRLLRKTRRRWKSLSLLQHRAPSTCQRC